MPEEARTPVDSREGAITEERVEPARRAPALPRAPNGAQRKLIPVKVKRFDSADYFLTKHLEKQRAAAQDSEYPHGPCRPETMDEEMTGTCPSRPLSSESERTDVEDMPTLPPSIRRKPGHGTAATGIVQSSPGA